MARVVVRFGPVLHLVSVLPAVIAVALWMGVVGGLGVPAGWPWIGKALVTVMIWVLALLCTGTVWVMWWMRQTYDADEVTVRMLAGTNRIRRDDATRIRAVAAQVGAGRAGRIEFPRVYVEGPNQNGIASRAGLDPGMTHAAAALDVLQEWLRLRPELADEPTAALFRERATQGG